MSGAVAIGQAPQCACPPSAGMPFRALPSAAVWLAMQNSCVAVKVTCGAMVACIKADTMNSVAAKKARSPFRLASVFAVFVDAKVDMPPLENLLGAT